jgi:hypothetical protein
MEPANQPMEGDVRLAANQSAGDLLSEILPYSLLCFKIRERDNGQGVLPGAPV